MIDVLIYCKIRKIKNESTDKGAWKDGRGE